MALGEVNCDKGWERRLNMEVTIGAAFVVAYEV